MLKDILQGKSLRHALHPFLVHFPMGLFVLSFLLDLFSHVFKTGSAFVVGAFYSMLFGIVFALLAAVPGFVDYSDIRRGHRARQIATFHMVLNLIAVGIYALNIGLRARSTADSSTPLPALMASLLCLALLTVSAYLGGSLVYDHGIGVGRHRRRTRTPEDTIHLATGKPTNAAAPDFVVIPRGKSMKDGETLRLDLEGEIIVLAKAGGEFYAFQEFCTHRFGPLSEGNVANGEIQCPWHRSCFNMRSGAVVGGPATAPLKTWPLRVEAETISIGRKPNPLIISPEVEPATASERKLQKSPDSRRP